jgi:ribosomal protein S18 acetylase RimI-like enzyme
MIEPIIRPARRDDLPGVLALYRYLHPDDPELDLAAAEPARSALLSSGMTSVIVADVADQLVSSGTLAIIPNLSRGAAPYGVIENVVTHPDHRRTGRGRAVLRAALDIARKGDCYKVVLATGSKQEATLRFYEGAGFSRGGKTYFEVRRS